MSDESPAVRAGLMLHREGRRSLIPSPSPEWRRESSNLPSPLGRGAGVRKAAKEEKSLNHFVTEK